MIKWIKAKWKYLITLAVIVIFFSYLGYKAYQGFILLRSSSLHFSYEYLLLSILCQIIGVLLAAFLWSSIIFSLGVRSPRIYDVPIYCASNLARKLPGTIWYALGRVFIYDRLNQPKAAIITGMVIELVVFALGGGVAAVIGLRSSPVLPDPRYSTYFLIGLGLFLIAYLAFSPTIIKFSVNKFSKGGTPIDIIVRRRDAILWLIEAFLVTCLGAGVLYFMIKSVMPDIPMGINSILFGWGLTGFIGPVAMWLPADIGIQDGIMYLILNPVLGTEYAALITLTLRIWVSILEIIIGFVGAVSLSRMMGFSIRSGLGLKQP